MGTYFLWFVIISICLFSLSRPWVGVMSYYFLALLGPQYIWWWIFDGIRVSMIVAVFTFIGIISSIVNGKYKYSFVINKNNFFVLTLWIAIVVSYFFGPYVDGNNISHLSPRFVFNTTNTICLFYLFSAIEINTLKKIKVLSALICLAIVILTYWSNFQYFTENWGQFHLGRLEGPSSIDGSSIYRDSNNFSMFFVSCLPFLYYFSWELKSIWFRSLLWLIILFALHAIFLTGSRGGLLGIGVVFLSILLFSNRKFLIFILLLFLLLFYQFQAGDVMKERSAQITNIDGEKSAGDRLNAWRGGVLMVIDNPLVGVGVGSFETAISDYIESRNMVAHNTLLQFTAESGLVAGFSYLFIMVLFFKNSIKIFYLCRRESSDAELKQIDIFNKASASSFLGFVACSMFLSLNTFEFVFVLLLFNNSLSQIVDEKVKSGGCNIDNGLVST